MLDVGKQYISFVIILLLIDMIWIKGYQSGHERVFLSINQKKELKMDLLAGGMFYMFAPLAYFMMIRPLSKNSVDAFKYGCLAGFLMYMTFDLTNKAIFGDQYPWSYLLMDISWGTLLFGIVSYLTYSYL